MNNPDIRNCRLCGGNAVVIDTRTTKDGHIRRRRKCLICGYRYNTLEVILYDGKEQQWI